MLNNQFLLTRTDGRNITILIFMGAANLWKYFVLKSLAEQELLAFPEHTHNVNGYTLITYVVVNPTTI
jgi:hypothetical protein